MAIQFSNLTLKIKSAQTATKSAFLLPPPLVLVFRLNGLFLPFCPVISIIFVSASSLSPFRWSLFLLIAIISDLFHSHFAPGTDARTKQPLFPSPQYLTFFRETASSLLF
jgi:hypothetical protein